MATNGSVSKKFECPRCERRFVRREHLQRHERSHTKEKPFGCGVCPQTFTRRDLLVRHSRINHTSPKTQSTSPTTPPSLLSSSSTGPQLQYPPASQRLPQEQQQSPPPPHDATYNQAQAQLLLQLPMQSPVYDDINNPPSDSFTLSPNSTPHPHVMEWQSNNGALNIPSNPSMPSPEMLMSNQMPETSWFATPHVEMGGALSSFLDNIALPSHQFSNFFNFEQPLPFYSPDPLPDTPIAGPESSQHQLPLSQHTQSVDATSEVAPHDSLTQFGSRLPSLQPEDHVGSAELMRDVAATAPAAAAIQHGGPLLLTNVSIEARSALISKLASFAALVPPDFKIVSRHALSRYMTGFIAGFHEHLPFLHLPSMSIETASVELVLALAAIGAQYCREPEKGLEIFKVAKAICIERIRRRDESSLRRLGLVFDHDANDNEVEVTDDNDDGNSIETAQALLILMAMATWFERRPPAREAPAIRSLLETLIRDEGLTTSSLPDTVSWTDWIEAEGAKRTKFVIFAFFNLHSIVFDIPPMILSRKIDMDLPCMEAEWKSPTEAAWRETRRHCIPEPKFLETLNGLFRGNNGNGTLENRPRFSSLGSYILIHALIQHIWLTQELFRGQPSGDPSNGSHIPASSVTTLEAALKAWQFCWERNPESSVNPLSPHGPLAFNSTALLRLAYIRINIDTGPIRSLGSCNPVSIAASIRAAPPVARSKRMTRAALHCAHALSIPIKLGINSIAHTRLFWSIQHALCSLESALLLTKWLESVTPYVGRRVEDGGLSEAEGRLLGFVLEMVAETEWAAPEQELLRDEKSLSAVVVRIWARLFRSDDIWEMVDVIRRSLEVYADMLDM